MGIALGAILLVMASGVRAEPSAPGPLPAAEIRFQGNAGLSAMDYGIIGNSATRNTIELYSIKAVPDGKAGYANVVRFYIYAGVPASGPDNCTIPHQVQALLYGYFIVSPRRYLKSIANGGSIYRSLQIRAYICRGTVRDGSYQQGGAEDAKDYISQATTNTQSSDEVNKANVEDFPVQLDCWFVLMKFGSCRFTGLDRI